jgi:hypothetical protein
VLVIWVDVTELDERQVGALSGEMQAQTESSEGDWGEGTGHPGVNVVYEDVLEAPDAMIETVKRIAKERDRRNEERFGDERPEARQRKSEWAIPMGPQVGLDTTSSASRQHRIDTGEYLRQGEAWDA